jgi:acid phosphatase
MIKRQIALLAALVPVLSCITVAVGAAEVAISLAKIETVVIIYAENRSFDNLYGSFPGANGLQNATPENSTQVDRDGSILKELPPVWGGLTPERVTPAVTQAQTEHLPNRPFAIDDRNGLNAPLNVVTRDLWHRFYQHQMQINGGKNDRFAAYGDSGGLVMGYYDGSNLPLWRVAKKYTLADNFFMGAFGGSSLNHFWLVCACVPYYPHADKSPAKDRIAAVEADGVTLKMSEDSPRSALEGIPKFINDGDLTPDFYVINTMQPPYQPSGNKPAAGSDQRFADPAAATTLPPQTDETIGDLLTARGIDWAWYAGAWQFTLDGKNVTPFQSAVQRSLKFLRRILTGKDDSGNAVAAPNFQFHHQPFNYFANFAPGTSARAKHLKDAGLGGKEFIKTIDKGALPQVSFYKPQGNLNQHPGYAELLSGDEHIADVVAHLEKSPQWDRMLVIITYDENGGFWDHVAPPKGDRWGPGSRVPTLIVSPFAKKGFVDHTQYDTTSILHFVTRRFGLPLLPGIKARDDVLAANGFPPMGDLTNALVLSPK